MLKEFLNLSFPVRKAGGGGGGGGQIFHLNSTRFFLAPFCLLLFCFCTSSRKVHDQPRLIWPCRVPTCVVLLKPFDQTTVLA